MMGLSLAWLIFVVPMGKCGTGERSRTHDGDSKDNTINEGRVCQH